MPNQKAIVTLAIGARYLDAWKENCAAHWGKYAGRHGYDLICVDRPLDDSMRARSRSPSWQKCLILSQEFSRQYERIVWIDADVLINMASPDISEGVPIQKVGAVEEMSLPTPELHRKAVERFHTRFGWAGAERLETSAGKQYYRNMGMPAEFDQVVQAGVLVLSPEHHRELFEKVYFNYEDKGGREFHMEMPALSYELLKADAVKWIDSRFNVNWQYEEILHYPFLGNHKRQGISNRLKRKLGRWLLNTGRACINASFSLAYFLHIGGGDTFELMKVVDKMGEWTDILL